MNLRQSLIAFTTNVAKTSAMSPKVIRTRKGRAALPPLETPTPEYYFENGLRKVKPYKQTYLAHAKQRWIKRTIPEVFASEMPRRCTESMIVGPCLISES